MSGWTCSFALTRHPQPQQLAVCFGNVPQIIHTTFSRVINNIQSNHLWLRMMNGPASCWAQ